MSLRKLTIDVARVYDVPSSKGSFRVLVDRVWPRGVKKEDLQLDAWMRDLAPSTELRKWFNHDPARWDEFRSRYFDELAGKAELISELREQTKHRPVLLLFAARNVRHNNAVALREFLLKQREK